MNYVFSHELDCCVYSSVTKADFQVLCLQVCGGCCVLKLCKDYVFFGINLPCVNPTSLRADRQCIIILKTFELVTLSFS